MASDPAPEMAPVPLDLEALPETSNAEPSAPDTSAVKTSNAAPTAELEGEFPEALAAQTGPEEIDGFDTHETFDASDRCLDPRSISAHRLTGSILATLVCGSTLPLVIGVSITSTAGRFVLIPLWLLLTALLTARALWWPTVRYRHTSYRLDEKSLIIRQGVWWQSVTLVPRTRVQHTDVTQGPLQRHFGLGTLILHTAGTQYAAVPLAGLTYETALGIRNLLVDHEPDDAV